MGSTPYRSGPEGTGVSAGESSPLGQLLDIGGELTGRSDQVGGYPLRTICQGVHPSVAIGISFRGFFLIACVLEIGTGGYSGDGHGQAGYKVVIGAEPGDLFAVDGVGRGIAENLPLDVGVPLVVHVHIERGRLAELVGIGAAEARCEALLPKDGGIVETLREGHSVLGWVNEVCSFYFQRNSEGVEIVPPCLVISWAGSVLGADGGLVVQEECLRPCCEGEKEGEKGNK